MDSNKSNAIKIGILFLVALIFNIAATNISDPILKSPDYLNTVFPNRIIVITANILNLICAFAMIFIPVILMRVVKKEHERLAVAYVVFRFLEGILFIYLAIKSLSIISLSREYLNTGNNSSSVIEILGNAVNSEIHWATIIYIIIFCFGAIAFYTLLYKSELVSKFFSVWGILATVYLFIGAMLGLFSIGIFNNIQLMQGMVYFAPPIALNELVLSIWLIVKGFKVEPG